ncbi:Response regulator receiver domain-containing protein [Dyadobacter koreensis]|uniref:Response regulator receiver domain-containing protein n=1 Tax=Dyadobacter koreensis TaxID=408657 RepID=A0A1H6T0Z8_9BACT|nr:response regulator transcription factor [Dyadobacter koreensis]SEI69915.1 Response regulator receiver domain-containing protein [Dyadobacter koreensis]
MKTTLIADDHHLVQKGLRIMLREVLGADNDVEFASNGDEVLTKLTHTHFHMLITDLNMPGTDSLEMVSSALKINPDLKILIVTVAPDAIFAPRYLRVGVKGYVSKEASDDALSVMVHNIRYTYSLL